MCCFTSKAEVSGTSIFARFTRPGTQALVYQMRYRAETPTAMILPLPVALPAREDSVRFKDLSAYPQFFADLDRGFPQPESFSLGRSKSTAVASAAPLTVHEVGGYVASFVPSMGDFGRLDPRFVIAKDVWDRIPGYGDFGFAVFQLKELEGTPHPIGLEYETRAGDKLFFPTVHIHDGSVHEQEHFDHTLYAQERGFDERAGSYEGPNAADARTGFVRSKDTAGTFTEPTRAQGILDASLLVHRTTLRGLLPNRDTSFDLRTILARRAGGCTRCDAGPSAGLGSEWLPIAATLAGLGWIVQRRDELTRKR